MKRALTGIAIVALISVASGYATSLHKEFYGIAFGNKLRPVTTPSTNDLAQFREFIWEKARKNPAFAARWPTKASFDAAAFKEFLALNPYKSVVGIDQVPAGGLSSELEVGKLGSVTPDDDLRNQDRLYVERGRVVLDAFGRAVPYDPRTTWFGGLTGTASQFDAHGATLRSGKKGSGILTAILHPEQFSQQGVALGSAPEFSQTYTDLAAIAKLRGTAADDWISLSFGANNMHGIEDLGNQIHTSLIGIPEFFLDAKITYWKQKLTGIFKKKDATTAASAPVLLTPGQVNSAMEKINAGKEHEVDPSVLFALGKEGGKEPTDVDLGILIIGNHHRLLEDFFQHEYEKGTELIRQGRESECRPEIREVLRRANEGDKAFEKACRDALAKAGFGPNRKPGEVEFAKVICLVMVEHSAPEAAPIFRAIRKIAKPELRRGGVYAADAGANPMDFVLTTKSAETDTIFELHARAFARVVTALRLWKEVLDAETKNVDKDATLQRVVDRMVARQLQYLDEAKARRDQYIKDRAAEHAKSKSNDGLLATLRRIGG